MRSLSSAQIARSASSPVAELALKAYPAELRARIGVAVDRGASSRPAGAARCDVPLNGVANSRRLREQTGALRPRPPPGGRPPALPAERDDAVRRLLAEQPDLTPEQIRDRLRGSGSPAAVSRTLTRLNLPRKKTRSANVTGVGGG
jgi:transposase